MLIVLSVNEVPIRLTRERWQHIVARHPEMQYEQDRVLETLGAPDAIQEGDFGGLLAVRLYDKTPLTRKHLVVVYKEGPSGDGFVLTAYFTSKPAAWRTVIWKR